jgi:hypothetical protein
MLEANLQENKPIRVTTGIHQFYHVEENNVENKKTIFDLDESQPRSSQHNNNNEFNESIH